MLPLEDARKKMLALAEPLGLERVSLDQALGRILGDDVRAPQDMPAFDYSAMDGYAVRHADFPSSGSLSLPVRGEARAGGPSQVLAPHAACRIFTGARIPEGADTVVMQEQVTRQGETATFATPPPKGTHIRRRGEDMAEGHIALSRGTHLRPSHLALLASCDRAWVPVSRRPVVTIVANGDELRLPGQVPPQGVPRESKDRIPESNGIALRAMAKRAGAHVRVAPIVPDNRTWMDQVFDEALATSDLVVTVGGASVGDHDLVRPCLEDIGVTLEFWKVAMKPGKPLLVGRRGRSVVLGLPGNPASAMIGFVLFGAPLLRAMLGHPAPEPPTVMARLRRDVRHEPGRTEFLRASLEREGSDLWATPLAHQASGAIPSLALADGLIVVPQAAGTLPQGATVDVIPSAEAGL